MYHSTILGSVYHCSKYQPNQPIFWSRYQFPPVRYVELGYPYRQKQKYTDFLNIDREFEWLDSVELSASQLDFLQMGRLNVFGLKFWTQLTQTTLYLPPPLITHFALMSSRKISLSLSPLNFHWLIARLEVFNLPISQSKWP